jgi:predicted RNA polymerase sigma factor
MDYRRTRPYQTAQDSKPFEKKNKVENDLLLADEQLKDDSEEYIFICCAANAKIAKGNPTGSESKAPSCPPFRVKDNF